MKILLFVLVPILLVTLYATFVWARNRQPTSVESGVDAFRREMSALSPDAAPIHRRPERGYVGEQTSPPPRRAPRPPGAGDPGTRPSDRPDAGRR